MDDKVEEEDWRDCDTEGRGKGEPDEEESPTDPACVPRSTKVFGMLMVGVEKGRLAVCRPSDSVEG